MPLPPAVRSARASPKAVLLQSLSKQAAASAAGERAPRLPQMDSRPPAKDPSTAAASCADHARTPDPSCSAVPRAAVGRWCKRCKAGFTGATCPSGHAAFSYREGEPDGSAAEQNSSGRAARLEWARSSTTASDAQGQETAPQICNVDKVVQLHRVPREIAGKVNVHAMAKGEWGDFSAGLSDLAAARAGRPAETRAMGKGAWGDLSAQVSERAAARGAEQDATDTASAAKTEEPTAVRSTSWLPGSSRPGQVATCPAPPKAQPTSPQARAASPDTRPPSPETRPPSPPNRRQRVANLALADHGAFAPLRSSAFANITSQCGPGAASPLCCGSAMRVLQPCPSQAHS